MAQRAIKERNKKVGIYFDESYDPDFDEAATALQILHDELSERDETLAKLRSMGVQLAGMSAKNAQDIAVLKRLIRGLAKAGQIDVEAAGEEEGRDFVDFLDTLPTEKQAAILDKIIEVALKSRSQEDFDHNIGRLIPSITAAAKATDEWADDDFQPEEPEPDEGE